MDLDDAEKHFNGFPRWETAILTMNNFLLIIGEWKFFFPETYPLGIHTHPNKGYQPIFKKFCSGGK